MNHVADTTAIGVGTIVVQTSTARDAITRTGRVALREESDLDVPDDQVGVVEGDLLLVLAVDAVVLEQVGGVVDRQERVVARDDGGVRVVEGGPHDEATDASESVDTEFHDHD